MWKTLNVKQAKILLPHNDYCNSCQFKQYVNREIKYRCNLFNERIKKDGCNFIRLEICKNAEVQNE